MIQDKVVKTIVAMDFMSEEAPVTGVKNAKGNYDLSIEKFVSLVKEYCAEKRAEPSCDFPRGRNRSVYCR